VGGCGFEKADPSGSDARDFADLDLTDLDLTDLDLADLDLADLDLAELFLVPKAAAPRHVAFGVSVSAPAALSAALHRDH